MPLTGGVASRLVLWVTEISENFQSRWMLKYRQLRGTELRLVEVVWLVFWICGSLLACSGPIIRTKTTENDISRRIILKFLRRRRVPADKEALRIALRRIEVVPVVFDGKWFSKKWLVWVVVQSFDLLRSFTHSFDTERFLTERLLFVKR